MHLRQSGSISLDVIFNPLFIFKSFCEQVLRMRGHIVHVAEEAAGRGEDISIHAINYPNPEAADAKIF